MHVSSSTNHQAADVRPSLVAQAQAHVAAGEIQTAIELCKELLRKHPKNADALHLAGVIALGQGATSEAENFLVDAFREEPLRARHLVALAQVYHLQGRRADSIETLEWAEALEPTDATIQFELGIVDHQNQAAAAAAQRFRKVIAAEPSHSPAVILLSQACAAAGVHHDRRVMASRVFACGSMVPAAHFFVFEATLAENPTAAIARLTDSLKKMTANESEAAAGLALSYDACFQLFARGLWNEAIGFLALFGSFRERWWQHIRKTRASALMMGPTYIPHRFGEVAAYLGGIVKARLLGWLPEIEMVLPVPAQGGANLAYMDYWRRWFTFMETPGPATKAAQHLPNYIIGIERDGAGRYHDLSDFGQLVEREWHSQGRPPLLVVTEEHRVRGQAMLKQLGVPADAWYVVLHVRESAYMESINVREEHNAHRNADVLDYLDAVRQITARGGWVLRIGHSGTRPLPPTERVIDVAHMASVPEFDVFLIGTCRFYLGDSSGPYVVATTFGRPIVAANFQIGLAPFQAHDLYIPKLYRDVQSKKFIPFKRALTPPLFRPVNSTILANEGVEMVDSSSQDIAALVGEMMDQLAGGGANNSEDIATQHRIHALFPPGALLPNSRIGRSFLRAHGYLLD